MKLTDYKVRILPKNDGFYNELIDFLKRKSTLFKRESALLEIFENKDYDIIKTNTSIPLDDVYGSTYQSDYRDNKNIFAISHEILSIGLDAYGYYGIITETNYGEIIDFNQSVLVPVYYKNEVGKYLIATFDVAPNITKDVA